MKPLPAIFYLVSPEALHALRQATIPSLADPEGEAWQWLDALPTIEDVPFQEGDVLLIRGGAEISSEAIGLLHYRLQKAGKNPATVVCLPKDGGLMAMPRAEMVALLQQLLVADTKLSEGLEQPLVFSAAKMPPVYQKADLSLGYNLPDFAASPLFPPVTVSGPVTLTPMPVVPAPYVPAVDLKFDALKIPHKSELWQSLHKLAKHYPAYPAVEAAPDPAAPLDTGTLAEYLPPD